MCVQPATTSNKLMRVMHDFSLVAVTPVRKSREAHREISMSIAPPPATTAAFLMARRTIMMASCRERSASSMNWSLPPRSTIVAVRALGHPLNRLNLSAPTWTVTHLLA